MPDHCIVYVSQSSELLKEDDLSAILLQSRQHNKKADITGVLLCLHGRIIQVLEGGEGSLNLLYDRIKQDDRHTNVTTLINQPIDRRLFSSWNMGYKTMTSSQLDEFAVVVNLDDKKTTVSSQQGITILELIEGFYNTNQHAE